jgi:hypothetical protein
VAPTQVTAQKSVVARKLQQTRINAVIRASTCCHKPPRPVMR